MASRISNTEWGLVIGAVAFIDLVQFMLDLLFVGLFGVNDIIDLIVGITMPLYCKLRGISMSGKKVGSMVGTFIFEAIPGVDAFPLWTLDIVLIMLLDKAERRAEDLLEKESTKQSAQQTPNKPIRNFS